MDLEALQKKALELRISTMREIATYGSGHIGGSLSIIELVTYLYYQEMHIDPKYPKKPDRDLFVCSKGHAGPAVYAVLADLGFFPSEWLLTLNQGGTNLPSHCDMNHTPGIDFTTGSLGQGISAAVGMALGQKLRGYAAYTYAVVGDGESQEGQVWEAAETAAQWHLGNCIAFTDLNKLQLDGYTDEIITMDNLETRWLGFGWYVQRIDGHDFRQIDHAVQKAKQQKDRPSMILMDTQKARGFIPGENEKRNHHIVLNEQTAELAIAALKERERISL